MCISVDGTPWGSVSSVPRCPSHISTQHVEAWMQCWTSVETASLILVSCLLCNPCRAPFWKDPFTLLMIWNNSWLEENKGVVCARRRGRARLYELVTLLHLLLPLLLNGPQHRLHAGRCRQSLYVQMQNVPGRQQNFCELLLPLEGMLK